MSPKFHTTKIISLFDEHEPMKPSCCDDWSIMGEIINENQLKEIIEICCEQGLRRRWNCLEKAYIAKKYIAKKHTNTRNVICVGSLYVCSNDKKSQFGFNYNPPLEFHAWLEFNHDNYQYILDIALPGVIENGLNFRDEQGPFLKGRKPVVLAGKVPPWLSYKVRERHVLFSTGGKNEVHL